jgi:hypothetical protein
MDDFFEHSQNLCTILDENLIGRRNGWSSVRKSKKDLVIQTQLPEDSNFVFNPLINSPPRKHEIKITQATFGLGTMPTTAVNLRRSGTFNTGGKLQTCRPEDSSAKFCPQKLFKDSDLRDDNLLGLDCKSLDAVSNLLNSSRSSEHEEQPIFLTKDIQEEESRLPNHYHKS